MNAKNEKKISGNAVLRIAIGERLRAERQRLDLKATDFSDLGGAWSSRSIYDWESGRSSPKAEFLAEAQELGLDVGFILSGSQNPALSESKARNFAIELQGRPRLSGPAPTPAHDQDTIYIPLLSATGSMSPGTEALAAHVVMGDVPVSLVWVRMNLPRSRPEALRLVHAYGDSMRGTLESGDFALVDTDIHSVDIDGVYVLEAHQRLFIKRVRQRMDGAYEISSDNPAIKQTDILNGGHEVRICGMVVYGWNGRRF
jgi:transcriptional regulator with XRE-family HTH domain